ncbi:2Fe-2S iron-sulfur cluster-binding protein [uncultured Prochlorococcus sp.]|uniref:2Fe-2S iron-sulfur cluster-binding protein n=1 Tax=uncultured Prochlorococcus sp. TaxID=159733 RepID=UPI00047443D7|nr:2Fe-2S iron-sulfur cluster-binding protein [uncultured Prochlorococcus sp.]
MKEKKNIKVIWPNDKETFVSDGDDWFSSAEKAGLDIPTGCLTGSCGACEIDVNGETVRACISEIKNYKESTLRVSLTTDPFWEK